MEIDLNNKIVACKEAIKALQTSQNIAENSVRFFEYQYPNVTMSLKSGYSYMRNEWLLVGKSNGSFPIWSIEMDIYENGNLIKNPSSNIPAPNGQTSNSLGRYNFIQQGFLGISLWAPPISLEIDGITFSEDDPTNIMFYCYMSGFSKDNPPTVEFKNIKIRSTLELVLKDTQDVGLWI